MGPLAMAKHPKIAFLGTAGMCWDTSYLSAIFWGRR